MTIRTAKLFDNGGSQAVRLPAEFRFKANEVFIRRDDRTGDVILSTRPRSTWREFMLVREALDPVPEDFLADRDQGTQERDPVDWRDR